MMINKLTAIAVVFMAGILFAAPAVAGDKRIGILVFDKVLTSDVIAPAEVFGVATRKSWFSDYEVVFIGVERKPVITTEEGIRLPVDATIYDAPELDALIVASAYDMDWLFKNDDLTEFLRSQAKTATWLGSRLFKNDDLTEFLRSQAKTATWLGSNCSGAFLYAHAGLLDGYRATTWAGGEAQLEREFPEIDVVFDQNVVVDRNRISSNGGVPSYQSALVMLSMMAGTGKAKTVYETIQLNRLIPWSDIEAYLPEDKK